MFYFIQQWQTLFLLFFIIFIKLADLGTALTNTITSYVADEPSKCAKL